MRLEFNVKVISWTTFLILLSFFSWYYVLPLYLKDLGASDAVVGTLYSIFGLGFTLAQVLGGYLADRLGRKKCIVYPTYTFPLLYLLLAYAKSWQIAALLYLISNIGSAIQMPSFTAIVGESSLEKGRAFGYFETFVAFGIAAGPLLGGILLGRIGVRGLILITAFVALITAIGRHIFLIETLGIKRFEKVKEGEREGSFLRFLIFGIFLFLLLSLTTHGPFLTLFQEEVLKMTRDKINFLFAIGNFLGAITSLIGGRLTDRIGAYRVLAISVILHPLLIVIWSFQRTPLFFALSFPFIMWAYITYQVLLTDISPETSRGTHIGIFGTITGLAGATGPFLGMQLKLRYGDRMPFFTALLIGLVSLAFLRRFKGKLH
jgi:MFS family permease